MELLTFALIMVSFVVVVEIANNFQLTALVTNFKTFNDVALAEASALRSFVAFAASVVVSVLGILFLTSRLQSLLRAVICTVVTMVLTKIFKDFTAPPESVQTLMDIRDNYEAPSGSFQEQFNRKFPWVKTAVSAVDNNAKTIAMFSVSFCAYVSVEAPELFSEPGPSNLIQAGTLLGVISLFAALVTYQRSRDEAFR